MILERRKINGLVCLVLGKKNLNAIFVFCWGFLDQGRSRVSASEERKASPIAVRIGSIDWERAPQVESSRKFLVEKENGREENRKGPLFEGGQTAIKRVWNERTKVKE